MACKGSPATGMRVCKALCDAYLLGWLPHRPSNNSRNKLDIAIQSARSPSQPYRTACHGQGRPAVLGHVASGEPAGYRLQGIILSLGGVETAARLQSSSRCYKRPSYVRKAPIYLFRRVAGMDVGSTRICCEKRNTSSNHPRKHGSWRRLEPSEFSTSSESMKLRQ